MDTLSSARKPAQDRSRERVEKVMAAAERLLLGSGPERMSIPEVARLSGVPRASIYQFFPNKYALLLAIADRHLAHISALIGQLDAEQGAMELERIATLAIRTTADYYNSHPVASMLILGGPMSREAYLSQEISIQDIGRQLRVLLGRHRPELVLPEEPDVMTLAVEVAFACLKHGYFAQARISDAMVDQARIAALAYLRTWLD